MERWGAEIRLRALRWVGELSSALDDGRGANQHRSNDHAPKWIAASKSHACRRKHSSGDFAPDCRPTVAWLVGACPRLPEVVVRCFGSQGEGDATDRARSACVRVGSCAHVRFGKGQWSFVGRAFIRGAFVFEPAFEL